VSWFLRNAWLIPALPTASFVIILLLGKRFPMKGSEVGIAAVAGSFVLAVLTAIAWIRQPLAGSGEERVRAFVNNDLFTWFDWQRRAVDSSGHAVLQHNPTNFGVHVDGLTVMLLFVVSFISLMIHIYSTGYMHGDRRYTYFFAALSLFSASMLVMVSSSNTMQFLLGWEGMGVCSFMLIGHWWEEKANSDAAVKAFLTTRTGDIGLLIGLAMTFFIAGQSFDIQKINETALAGHTSHALLLVAAIALFGGVVGKSAQFPLHTWLPDAMAGPTPVSALIHAATMVVAGVYLVARFYGVFSQAFHIFTPGHSGMNLVAIIGGTTIIIAAFLAFVQDDIKKVLAYSTISQLGYMVMALGVGAWTGAIFHLFTHAFFKADLFLGAGSVSHGGSHHSFDMKKDMGGLRKYMPTTYLTFVIASGALAGIFPLAGFWSKDEILVTAGHNGYRAFMILGLVGAAMTAGYMARCVWLTFHGEYRGHGEPHESPRSITVPLVILTAMSVVAGLLNGFGLHTFTKWTANQTVLAAMAAGHVTEAKFSFPLAILSVALALAAAGVVWAFYEYHAFAALHGRTERSKWAHAGYSFIESKYYLDVLYTDTIVYAIKSPIARAGYWINQNVIDGIVNGIAIGSRKVAQFAYDVIDQEIVDGAINGAGFSAEGGGGILRTLQTGRVQQYAAAFFGLGVVAIGVGLLLLTGAFS
jgi:NADH-quinone oxidoreductase subunit L